jgi:hypothetical protein
MMNLDTDKFTTSKQDTIEDIEINETTRSNLNTRNHTYGLVKLRTRMKLSKNNK